MAMRGHLLISIFYMLISTDFLCKFIGWKDRDEWKRWKEMRWWEDVWVRFMKRRIWMEMMKVNKKTGRCMGSSDEKVEMNEEDENRWEECPELEMIRCVGLLNASKKSLLLMVGWRMMSSNTFSSSYLLFLLLSLFYRFGK